MPRTIVHLDDKSAESAPLVHLRAAPGFYRHTFYEFAGSFGSDARQPLPQRFAARWASSGATETDYLLWRDLRQAGAAPRVIRYDEHENAAVASLPNVAGGRVRLAPPPSFPSGDGGGWAWIDTAPAPSWLIASVHSGTMRAVETVTALANGYSP